MRAKLVVGALSVTVAFTAGLVPAAVAGSARCRPLRVPVAFQTPASISGTLCEATGGHAGTVHLLVPGSTYGQTVWDFPYHPELYSYVRALNAAGVATFAIDRFGAGTSSAPPSPSVTLDTEVDV